MCLSWLKAVLDPQPVDAPCRDEWTAYLQKNVPLYPRLSDAEQARLRDDLRVFVSEKNWEGCGGQVLTDEMKVTIAANACLLLLGLESDTFRRVRSVLVYPTEFRVPEYHGGRLGGTQYRGPVILSWDTVIPGGRHYLEGRNVVLREFAHQLDYLDGEINGTPPLRSPEQAERWRGVMTAEYDKLVKDCARGRATLLGEYATKNPAEFFAVATECFFEQPVRTRRRHPLLYELLCEYYRLDPVLWFADDQPERLNEALR
jgi:Mlc titration factor MtfA (ptsG expression regulator)